jgi:hypothetical protein
MRPHYRAGCAGYKEKGTARSNVVGCETVLSRVANAENVHVVAVDGEEDAVDVSLVPVELFAKVDVQVGGFVRLRAPRSASVASRAIVA